MNELDAIQEQMKALGIDVSPNKKADNFVPTYQLDNPELTEEELAKFKEEAPKGEGDDMPEYDFEQLKIDMSPMLAGLPKDVLADYIMWIVHEWESLNLKDEKANG